MVSSVREKASHRLAVCSCTATNLRRVTCDLSKDNIQGNPKISWGCGTCLKEKLISANDFRVNEGIRVAEVRLIGPTGDNVGVVPIKKALEIARDAELDLVEVSPNADPPVCRAMDFGKFIYERAKKEREAKKAQTKIELKEIRLRPKTNEHHRGFKVKDARRWLESGMKVKVTIRFRGREMDYPEIALEDLKEIALELADVSTIEQVPQMEGRTMLVILAPAKGGAKKKEKDEQPQAESEAK
jgi:translation initiation factor IF-3